MAKKNTVEYVSDIRKNCKSISSAVDKILNECKITTPPIDVSIIANSMGIDLFGASFREDNLLGIIVDADKPIEPFDSKRFIAVNNSPNNYRTRRIFTIAHEIGHYILHCNDSLNYFERHLIGDGNSHSFAERQTDYFAACLLMPQSMFKREFDKVKNVSDINEIIVHLKKTFNVSTKSVVRRLAELNLIDVSK